jgi:hypothetical protein
VHFLAKMHFLGAISLFRTSKYIEKQNGGFIMKHFCFLRVAALWAAVAMFFAYSCSSGGGKNDEHPENSAVNLFLGKLQVPFFDSISIRVSAANMENIYHSVNSIKDNIKINNIPAGENRKFEVTIYADYGKAVQKGEVVADINANQTVTIPIPLTAFYGFLKIEVPLGLANSAGVYSGKLILGNMEFQMQIENGKGVFNTTAFPLNQQFSLSLELKGINGEILFTGQREVMLSAILQTETMQLQSTMGSAILELTTTTNGPAQILAMLPISVSRIPENYGDLFFTEIFADPQKSGSDFEYMEIYNATLDTLELSQCRIAQLITSNTPGQNRLNMPEDLILPPAEFLYFGRDSVGDADFNYKAFMLVNSGQPLGFFCGSNIIDTLRFSASGENPFPLLPKKAMQLPLSNFATRTSGSSWCLGFSPKEDANCQ